MISEAPPAARGGRTSGGGDVGARRRSCTAKEIQTGRAGLRPRAATRAASAPTSLSPKDTRDSEQYRASNQTIDHEQIYEEYSGSARTVIDSVHYIDDPVVGSQITSSDTRHMPLRQFTHLDYDFTTEEKKYLSTENTCVIDNLIGVYGKELKLNKDKLIKLNKKNSWGRG